MQKIFKDSSRNYEQRENLSVISADCSAGMNLSVSFGGRAATAECPIVRFLFIPEGVGRKSLVIFEKIVYDKSIV